MAPTQRHTIYIIYPYIGQKSVLLFRLQEDLSAELCSFTERWSKNYYFFAELNNGIKMNLKSNEGQLKWFLLDEINGLKMPFTAKHVTEHWLDVGRNTTDIYGGIADGEKVVFTEMCAF